MNSKEIKNLIKRFGTQSEFCQLLGEATGENITQQAVSRWVTRGMVPASFCIPLEMMTDGDTTAHQLRPDVFPPRV